MLRKIEPKLFGYYSCDIPKVLWRVVEPAGGWLPSDDSCGGCHWGSADDEEVVSSGWRCCRLVVGTIIGCLKNPCPWRCLRLVLWRIVWKRNKLMSSWQQQSITLITMVEVEMEEQSIPQPRKNQSNENAIRWESKEICGGLAGTSLECSGVVNFVTHCKGKGRNYSRMRCR